jgi:hypothetical protein
VKLPEDFENRAFVIFSSEEMSEPLISVYTILSLMIAAECDEIIIFHDVTRYSARGNEKIVLPTAFGGDYLDDCIRRVFERDSLIQELFDCDFNNREILITSKDTENVN